MYGEISLFLLHLSGISANLCKNMWLKMPENPISMKNLLANVYFYKAYSSTDFPK